MFLDMIDCSKDIWGGRLKEDKFISKNSSKNKHFNKINFNSSGNYLICGGNSNYVCLYDMHYQILVKRFCLPSNRSLDGVLHKLNSSNLKEGKEQELIDAEVSDSDYERTEDLPGTKKIVIIPYNNLIITYIRLTKVKDLIYQ